MFPSIATKICRIFITIIILRAKNQIIVLVSIYCYLEFSGSENISDEVKQETSTVGSQVKSEAIIQDLQKISEVSSIIKHSETILDQVKHIRTAISTTIDNTKNKPRNAPFEGKILHSPSISPHPNQMPTLSYDLQKVKTMHIMAQKRAQELIHLFKRALNIY